ncbi:unnamed protein product [marine sediment metagenome]|uniref:RnfC Barrel sandwich hybrid domain-containing protein n=1 Tax=marine sediment metagenome TaxID=412755 RepID=X0XTV1_9ZZZZ
MRIRGGFNPRITGKPLSIVEQISIPEKLYIGLRQNGFNYIPLIKNGQKVKMGDPLAETSIAGGKIYLPAPVSGKVIFQGADKNYRQQIIIEVSDPAIKNHVYESFKPQHISSKKIREILSKAGIWPFFWSSYSKGIPSLDLNEQPKAIIVNTVLTEPFRASGFMV